MEEWISIFEKNMLVLNSERRPMNIAGSQRRGALRGVCMGVCSQKVRARNPYKMGVSLISGRTLSPPSINLSGPETWVTNFKLCSDSDRGTARNALLMVSPRPQEAARGPRNPQLNSHNGRAMLLILHSAAALRMALCRIDYSGGCG
jgi:hypothetical protein